jgi:hypothetical protein
MCLLTENILAEQDDVIQTGLIEHFASFLITIVTVLLLVKHRHFGTNNLSQIILWNLQRIYIIIPLMNFPMILVHSQQRSLRMGNAR